MKSQERPWVRRIIFADRRYRSTLLAHAFVLALASALLSYAVEAIFAHYALSVPALQGAISPANVPRVGALLAFLVLISAFILFGLLISRRLVAPFFRMRRHMDAVTEGRNQQTEFHFRTEDFFVEAGESYNRLLQVVQAQRQRLALLEQGSAVGPEKARPSTKSKLD